MPRASGDRGWHLTKSVPRITVIRWASLFGNMAAEPFEWVAENLCVENRRVLFGESIGFRPMFSGFARKSSRRTSSKLPELVEPVIATPLIHAGTVTKTLGVAPQAARRIVAELGLREMTGRGRFRAWGGI